MSMTSTKTKHAAICPDAGAGIGLRGGAAAGRAAYAQAPVSQGVAAAGWALPQGLLQLTMHCRLQHQNHSQSMHTRHCTDARELPGRRYSTSKNEILHSTIKYQSMHTRHCTDAGAGQCSKGGTLHPNLVGSTADSD